MNLDRIVNKVNELEDYAIKLLSELIEIKAISPDTGGDGELEKAELLLRNLEEFEVERHDAEDERAAGGIRPNIVAKIVGKKRRTVWIVTHMDVVPEGDASLWNTPPFKAIVKDGRVYGRGSEDNGQSLVASLIAGKAIIELDIVPEYSLGLVFVSDEETGSKYGIQHLLNQNIFSKDDLFIVPDGGTPSGNLIEIAEKSILWLKFSVFGKQTHASTPENGLNASRRTMEFILALDKKLKEKFNKTDKLFSPPYSTFEPTKRERNVDNVNTIPGLDISYMDCRILPDYPVEEVLEVVKAVACEFESRDGEKIDIEIVQKESSPPTSEDSEIVKLLKKSIKVTKGVDSGVYGMGGNTCAAFFRKAGFETAVWSTVDNTAHQPNEYAKIRNLVEDAKVFAVLPFMKP